MIDCSGLPGRLGEICTGVDQSGNSIEMPASKRLAYLKMWFPDVDEDLLLEHIRSQKSSKERAGATKTKFATGGKVRPCSSCGPKIFPQSLSTANNVSPISIGDNVKRNFIMHIWPKKNVGTWQWNCDQVLKRADLFNGKRVIGVAVDDNTDPVEKVIEYMKDFTDDIFVVRNNPRLGEVATFPQLLSSVSDHPDTFTFYCHAKGVRHNEKFGDGKSTILEWTKLMYELCLSDWESVKNSLEQKAMTGCFKRYGNFKTPGNHRWHYSGTFYWFRNNDVFSRNWSKVDKMFFGAESWPGLMFTKSETDCLFLDDVGDLYSREYWESTIFRKLKDEKKFNLSLLSEK